jgi:hypothetical protein
MNGVNKMGKSWVVPVEEGEDGDFYITFNEEMLEGSGFKIGDNLDWIDNKDGTFMLTKKKDKVWVMVECISTFRQRYMVEAPADHPEYALDDVVCETPKEFSQSHIGEQIVSHRVVTQEEALRICDEDNDYCKTWNDEKKIEVFFTKEGEKRDY